MEIIVRSNCEMLIVDIFVDNCEESWVSCKRKSITIYNQRGAIRGIDNNIFAEVGIEYERQFEKAL